MRALNVQLPWAWLIVHGFKTYELRTRRTLTRGRVPIRATKFDRDAAAAVRRRFPDLALANDDELKRLKSCVLGTAEISDCVPVAELADVTERSRVPLSRQGGWPIAWVLKKPQALKRPLPCPVTPGPVTWATVPARVAQQLRGQVSGNSSSKRA